MKGNQEQASGTVTIQTADIFEKLTFTKSDGSEYRLESGDELVIEGRLTEGGKTYTSNPYMVSIK